MEKMDLNREEHIVDLSKVNLGSYNDGRKEPSLFMKIIGCTVVGITMIFLISLLIFCLYRVAEYPKDCSTLKILTTNQGTAETFYYDINTNIVYVKLVSSLRRESLSPYYVVNEDGEAEVAILGKNYFVE